MSDSAKSEIHFIARSDTCAVSITLYTSDLNRHVIRYRNPCNFAPDRDADILELLLQEALKRSQSESLKTFAWGRLTPETNSRSILGRRLARAAMNSQMWTDRQGRSARNSDNNVVRDLLNTHDVFREVAHIFEKFGFEISVSSVEKVLIFMAQDVPDFDILKGDGITKNDRVPIDGQIWFAIKK